MTPPSDMNTIGVVLVHGACHTPEHFADFTSQLKAKGYQVEAPQLASSSPSPPDQAFEGDVKVIKEAIHNITATRKNAIVMMHSYGGNCGSEAVAEFLQESNFNPQPNRGTIVHLVYIAAAVILKGGAMINEGQDEDYVVHIQDNVFHFLEPFHRWYHRVPRDKAYQAMQLVRPQSLEAWNHPQKHCGWGEYGLPITYIACTQDRITPRDTIQKTWIERIRDAEVKDFTLVELDTDHSPWLSMKEEFVAVVDEVLMRTSSKD